MATVSREEARVFIEKLRRKKGDLSREGREWLERTNPELLEELEEQFHELRQQLGASTRTLEANLYTTDTRFVYELIQNAEDNDYHVVQGSSESPWLHFSLFQDQIVIDSNEDGFSKDNIQAVCSVGQSTKEHIKGYIGEKGIGFKSVFKVARKVHVQSGPYSFAFEYQRGMDDYGLGLITPLNEEYLELPEGVRTRTTLHLLPHCDRVALRKEFLDLPDTLLLFLQKLQQLTIEIRIPGHPDVEQQYSVSSSEAEVSLHKRSVHSNSNITRRYWTTRRSVTNMPTDCNHRKDIKSAEVVIAFPLDIDDHPVIENQHVFAFLPLRKAGYKFLIQSDFITHASREDVFDIPWNNRLLDEAVEAFLQSVKDFLSHPTLRHFWLRYIPTDPIADDFWSRIQTRLLKELSTRRLFFPRDGDQLFQASQLRILMPTHKDDEGQPLLRDLDPNTGMTAYVSESYDQLVDLPILRQIGIRDLSAHDFLWRLMQDLNRSDSRMRSMPVSAKWHTSVAKYLITLMTHSGSLNFIKTLPIVPLETGKWVPPRNASIYFPTSGGIEVPKDLGLALVDANALSNKSRKTLFSRLNVTECAPSLVIPLIEQWYSAAQMFEYSANLSHIKFIFWHRTELPSNTKIIKIHILSTDGWFWASNVDTWVYCSRSHNPNALHKLLRDSIPETLEGKTRLLAPWYYDELENFERRNDMTAIEWLERLVCAKHTLQLRCKTEVRKRSPELEYVAKHHPDSLLGVLQTNWRQYQETSEWDYYFKSTKVPILHSEELRRLDTTYLPLPKLRTLVTQLDLDEHFGFIKELEHITDSTAGTWSFLKRFGVEMEENVSFWLALLKKCRNKTTVKTTAVFEIYINLQRFVKPEDVKRIKTVFEKEELVCIPSTQSEEPLSWKSLGLCVWDGPEWYAYQFRLNAIEQYRRLYSLFVTTLEVKNAQIADFLDYLRAIKKDQWMNGSENKDDLEDLNRIVLLYEQLDKEAHTSNDIATKEQIRYVLMATGSRFSFDMLFEDFRHNVGFATYYNALWLFNVQDAIFAYGICGSHTKSNWSRLEFEKRSLVFRPTDRTWHSPSSCIWAEDRIKIPGKASVASFYAKRKTFFLGVLAISKPSLAMHIFALKRKVSQDLPIKQSVIQEMLNISAFDVTPENLEALSDCKCLPVTVSSGETRWMDRSGDFAIVDLREYGHKFKGRINILDFSLEEVHSLQRFLLGLRLEGQYLSRSVRETTTAQGGSFSERLTNDLRRKSYAICRYAAHLGNERGRDDFLVMHRTLQNMNVYVSDGIAKSLSITQNRTVTKIAQDTAYFHLHQEGEELSLYVPQSTRHQQLCLSRELPITLLKHLGATSSAALAELGPIITATSLFVVDELLQQAGIIEIEGIQRLEGDNDLDPISPESESRSENTSLRTNSRQGAENLASNSLPSQMNNSQDELWPDTSTPTGSTFSTAAPTGEPLGQHDKVLHENISISRPTDRLFRSLETTEEFSLSQSASIQPSFSSSAALGTEGTAHTPFEAMIEKDTGNTIEHFQTLTFQSEYQQYSFEELRLADYAQHRRYSDQSSHAERLNLYEQLLDAVIQQAQSLSNLPKQGETIVTPAVFSRKLSTLLAVDSPLGGELEKKIGAAGELFVFEYLKHLALPGFTLSNWQSTIRHRVGIHERYTNISPWRGSETADIVYQDQNSTLTDMLIDKGYFGPRLISSPWKGRSPKYYIEVKTTIGIMQGPFFCSQGQYDRMERMRLKDAVPSDEVYLVARVFSLGTSGMGLKLYLDPATLRDDYKLTFRAEKYSVTPNLLYQGY